MYKILFQVIRIKNACVIKSPVLKDISFELRFQTCTSVEILGWFTYYLTNNHYHYE